MLLIPEDVRADIFRCATACYPEEGCGILIGDPVVGGEGRVVRAIAATNTAEERWHRYLIDPLAIVRADREARRLGMEIVGFFHSHPDHPAVPSGTDLSLAWPDYVYVIAAVSAAGAGELRGWRLVAAGEPMAEIPLG